MIRLFLIFLLLLPSVSFAWESTNEDRAGYVANTANQVSAAMFISGTQVSTRASYTAIGDGCSEPQYAQPGATGGIQLSTYRAYSDGTLIGSAVGTLYGDRWFKICRYGGASGYFIIYKQNGFSSYNSCSDGVLNGDETAVDLGGTVCDPEPPAEPATCSDGVQSPDETGIDCGDALCVDGDDVCSTYCPVGFGAESRQGLTGCYSLDSTADYTVDAVLGVCPSNMYVSNTDSSKCVSWALPVWAASDYLETVTAPAADTTPWNNVFTQENTTYDYVSTVYNGVTTEVDTTSTAGTSDTGTAVEQETVITTVTAADGSKVETTVTSDTGLSSSGVVSGTTTTIVRTYDPAGSLLGSTSDTEAIGSTETAGAPFGAPDGTALAADDDAALTGFVTRYTEFTDAVSASPLMSPVALLFAGPDTSGKDANFSLDMGSYGVKSASLSNYDAVWSALGYVFMFLAVLAASRMVMVKGA